MPPPPPPPRQPLSSLLLCCLLLLLLLGATTTAAAAAAATTSSSALLVLDPDANDGCFKAPQACVEPCSSALRVDVTPNGQAILTPSGPDYKLSCDTGFKSDDPSYQAQWGPRGTINVSCAAMTARGFETAWPPPISPTPIGWTSSTGENNPNGTAAPAARKPALAFDSFDCKGFGATALDSKPYGAEGALCQSVFAMPDARLMSGVFDRNGYFDALCHPWHSPSPGFSLNLLYPILILTVARPGSGRVQVMPVGRRYGSCLQRSAWTKDASCTQRSTGGVTYRILEGRLLNETARPTTGGGSKPSPCPLGTCPRKIIVPEAAISAGIKAGPRDNICASACDGGGQANATAKAIDYPSTRFVPVTFSGYPCAC